MTQKWTEQLRTKAKKCVGCHNDFYNRRADQQGPCWSLPGAKIVKRVRVPSSQGAPWKQPAENVYDCRHDQGYAFMDPSRVARINASCKADPTR